MTELRKESCVACRADSPRVTNEEVTQLHSIVPEWSISNEKGIFHLDRTFKFEDFEQAITFADLVGKTAEEEDHHPRLTVEWGSVKVAWWTHKIKGLHRNDFIMAAKSDEIYGKPAN